MRRLLALLITFSLLPAAAALANGSTVVRDCTDDGVLQGHYSQKDLRDALASIPSDVDEYTNCRDVIRRAAFGGAGGGKGGGGGGNAGGEFGGFQATPAQGDPLKTATPQERKQVSKATKEGGTPLRLQDDQGKPIGGALIRPSQVARRTGPGTTDVPTPLLIVAMLLALAALAAAAPTFRHRVLPRRGA
jgi:hypothetical protein